MRKRIDLKSHRQLTLDRVGNVLIFNASLDNNIQIDIQKTRIALFYMI